MGYVFLFFVLVLSLRSGMQLWEQRAVLSEFNVSHTVAIAILLYPIGMAAFILLPLVIGTLGSIFVVVTTLLPGVILSRKAQQKLQLTGTDRSQPAEELAANAFMTGIGCILYFLVVFGIDVASHYSSNPLK